MAPILALHLGAHKTATTFMQRCFEDRRRELLRMGVRYFGSSELRGVEGLIFPTPRDVRDRLAAPLQRQSAATLRRVVDASVPERAKRVLVSEENILGSPRLNIRRAKLYPALIDRLACLPPEWNTDSLEVYLAIRDYAGFFASCHSTIASQGDWMPLGPDKQAEIAKLPRRWTDVIADIRTVLPRAEVVVWRYEDLQSLGQQVINAMVGGPFEMDFSQKGTMAALTTEGMEQIQEAWRRNGEEPLDPKQAREIRDATATGQRYDPWNPALKAAMSAAYAEDWDKIQRMRG